MRPLKNSYVILGILLGHAPDGKAQAFMTQRHNEMYMQICAEFETNQELELEKALVAMLHEGLRADTWPWDDEPSTTDPTTTSPLVTDPSLIPKDDRSLAGWNDIIQKSAEQAREWGPWGKEGRQGL